MGTEKLRRRFGAMRLGVETGDLGFLRNELKKTKRRSEGVKGEEGGRGV